MKRIIPFGEWLPDLPQLQEGGLITAENVLPDASSYRPFPSVNVFSTSLSARCQGAIYAKSVAGTTYNFAGDNNKLYQLTGTSWSNVSRLVGGTYSTSATDMWEFAHWADTVIAVNGTDVPQRISLGAANFVLLPGSPPTAKHIATIRDFVVLGNISATAAMPQAVAWCAINNADSWTADAATLADRQDLVGNGGYVQRVIGGEYGVILQERAIFRMTFVGSPLVFQFDRVQQDIGAWMPGGVVAYQNMVFFLSENGFYVFDGSNVEPIGLNKIDKTFLADVDKTQLHRIVATIDPDNKVVAWAYPSIASAAGNPNLPTNLLIYNWAVRKWTRITNLNVEMITKSYISSQATLSYFNAAHQLARFNGTSMAANIATTEYQFNPEMGGRTFLNTIRPLVQGSAIASIGAVSFQVRDRMVDQESSGSSTYHASAGFAECRSTGVFFKFTLTTNNAIAWSHLLGLEVEVQPAGKR